MTYNVIWKGFRFGALLQVAVGPVCLFIFQTAASSGFGAAEAAVLAVTLADLFYVTAAILGIGALIERSSSARNIFKYLGAAVIILFGISSILGSFEIHIIPGFGTLTKTDSESAFIKALLLTLNILVGLVLIFIGVRTAVRS